MIDRAAVSEAFRRTLTEATGRPCGLGKLPLVEGQPAEMPYLVLYPQGGPVGGAPLADASEDSELLYQVSAVAARTDQAEWMADRVRRAVLERTATGGWRWPIDVPGADVWARELRGDAGTDDAGPAAAVVSYPQRFCLTASG
ncbi:hypothetical protein OEIGOIKO_03426 [Streptomyces chrestomyceticus JCM 4735]|uniref:Uncharacterized protein n=1 Tax=Streptomyces chrestomyceticus JCM 4735 TaxID=1306181 RepID=A0A7U9PYU7_9ACTN|nr:hypothetical protein [Streptomyces chrestomyceticus]GCD35680.1 hypothetical protein OEIGOIKO_03426 [Streptomyces chrestomyceticus JCM 4735]